MQVIEDLSKLSLEHRSMCSVISSPVGEGWGLTSFNGSSIQFLVKRNIHDQTMKWASNFYQDKN